ncbi:MAG: hypothetical protein PVJ57_22555 [Phycisphaerae bacterium]
MLDELEIVPLANCLDDAYRASADNCLFISTTAARDDGSSAG